jgi:cell division protein ZapA
MSESQLHSVTVRIAGDEHVIRSNAKPEHTIKCADLVSSRIEDIRQRAGLLETHKAAILAALSLADELLQAQDQDSRTEEGLGVRAQTLTQRIERALG